MTTKTMTICQHFQGRSPRYRDLRAHAYRCPDAAQYLVLTDGPPWRNRSIEECHDAAIIHNKTWGMPRKISYPELDDAYERGVREDCPCCDGDIETHVKVRRIGPWQYI